MSLLVESPRAHVAKFYGRLRLIRGVFIASKFSVLKLIRIVILWVYYIIPFGLSLIGTFGASLFIFLNYFVWLRIYDEGSVHEMRIWSILLIKSDLKCCMYLSRSLFIFLRTCSSLGERWGMGVWDAVYLELQKCDITFWLESDITLF